MVEVPATDAVASLEHDHAPPRLMKVARCGQAGEPAADHGNVVDAVVAAARAAAGVGSKERGPTDGGSAGQQLATIDLTLTHRAIILSDNRTPW